MSHMKHIQLEIKDLEALAKAGKELGLQFNLNQKNYKWFGKFMGDSPLPPGLTVQELGHCDHALSVVNNKKAYEVGIIRSKTGEGYQLLYDFWAGGKGLEKVIGEGAQRLTQEYAAQVTMKEYFRQGKRVTRETLENGSIRLVVTGGRK